MKINTNFLIDTADCYLSRNDAKELILEIDLSRAEVDFTLDIIKSLISSLMKNDEMTKEEIIKDIF